jgi:hypothetical protein
LPGYFIHGIDIPCQITESLHTSPKQIERQHLCLFKWFIAGLEGESFVNNSNFKQ